VSFHLPNTKISQVLPPYSYVPVHLEYIITEILKNSFRATVEHQNKRHGSSSSLPPVVITIAPSRLSSDPDSSIKTSFLSMRIRDQGGGVTPSNMARIFSYAFTTAGRGAESNFSGDDDGGGPYAAQHIGGGAAIGGQDSSGGNLFGEIAGKGLQTGMGTIAGLGYGLPMSRLYTKYISLSHGFGSL
jgi:26S proteasome regulatory subunit T1